MSTSHRQALRQALRDQLKVLDCIKSIAERLMEQEKDTELVIPPSVIARENAQLGSVRHNGRNFQTNGGGIQHQDDFEEKSRTAPSAAKVRVDAHEDGDAKDHATAASTVTTREDLCCAREAVVGESQPIDSSDYSSGNNGKPDVAYDSADSDSPSISHTVQTKPYRVITQEEMGKFLSYQATLRRIFNSINEKYHTMEARPDEYRRTWHRLAASHEGRNKTMIQLYKPKLQSWKPAVNGFDNKYDCDSPLKEGRTPDDLQWETWQADVAGIFWLGDCAAKDRKGKRVCRM